MGSLEKLFPRTADKIAKATIFLGLTVGTTLSSQMERGLRMCLGGPGLCKERYRGALCLYSRVSCCRQPAPILLKQNYLKQLGIICFSFLGTKVYMKAKNISKPSKLRYVLRFSILHPCPIRPDSRKPAALRNAGVPHEQ